LKSEFFIDNLLVRIHLIIERILVHRPCAMGVRFEPIATQRAAKEFSAHLGPKVRYLVRRNPPYGPTVLPTVWGMDYSRMGYSRNPCEIRCTGRVDTSESSAISVRGGFIYRNQGSGVSVHVSTHVCDLTINRSGQQQLGHLTTP